MSASVVRAGFTARWRREKVAFHGCVGALRRRNRFDKYFEPGLPYLDRVVIRVIKDPITQMAAFKAGEIDFIIDFSPEHVDSLKAQNPSALIMTGKETTPMVALMKVTVPRDGKPMSKDRPASGLQRHAGPPSGTDGHRSGGHGQGPRLRCGRSPLLSLLAAPNPGL